MRLLIIEDDRTLGEFLKKALEKHAYGVDVVRDGEAAVLALKTLNFKVVILDINLPKLSGLEVLRKIRQEGNKIPVILLTARDTAIQRVEGLDLGADDYLIKPFDLSELQARIRALVRRSDGKLNPVFKAKNVELDPAAMLVKLDGKTLTITAKEFHLLKVLMERSGKFVTKPDIEYVLYDADAGAESNVVEVTIYNLRKKLGSDFIKTIRGVGYMVET